MRVEQLNYLKFNLFLNAISFILILTFVNSAFASSTCSLLLNSAKTIEVDGRLFQIESVLSQDGQSIIYRLKDGLVLRIFKTRPRRSRNRFVKAYELMFTNGISNLVKIIESGDTWVLQEYAEIEFTLNFFLENIERLKSNNSITYLNIVSKLKEFSLKTYKFEDLGDFHPDQLIWTGRNWKLLDWGHDHEPANKSSEYTFLLGLGRTSTLATEVVSAINNSILRFRASLEFVVIEN